MVRLCLWDFSRVSLWKCASMGNTSCWRPMGVTELRLLRTRNFWLCPLTVLCHFSLCCWALWELKTQLLSHMLVSWEWLKELAILDHTRKFHFSSCLPLWNSVAHTQTQNAFSACHFWCFIPSSPRRNFVFLLQQSDFTQYFTSF